ncbi:MAG: hypothetical protein HY260_06220 [Chloroflexi bacterium]|nr:hypothetical protein [Chloroflexota bacterium]
MRLGLARLSERTVRLLTFIVTFALGLAVTSSHFHMIDEGSMLVTAVNIVDRGEFHTNQLGWAQWSDRPGNQIGFISDSGDVYSKKSPLVIALMTPLVALARLFPALGLTRTALLLGPTFTGLTASLLYAFSQELGYSRASGILATMAFVTGTMALMYAKTALGEPVASLGLLTALFALHRAGKQKASSQPEILCGAGLALAIGTSAVYALLVPVFATALAVVGRKQTSLRTHAARLVRFGLPVAAMGAGLAGYNFVRFGSLLQTGYHFIAGQESFTTPLWWGIAGLTVSPARGFLWYNPPALLSIASWPRFHRAHRWLSWAMLAVIAVHLLVFGLWWEWWGGAWGPRYLLPIVPFVILACLPLFERAVEANQLTRAGVSAILLAGLVVQIAAVAIDYNTYDGELEAQRPAPPGPRLYYHDPALVYDVARSPIVVHFQRLFSSDLDFAWRPLARPAASIPEIVSDIRSQARARDVIVYLAPELIDPLIDARDLPPVYGLPVNVRAADAAAARLFLRALRQATRVWLITWYRPGDPANWYEARLRGSWASVSEESLDGYRVMLFALTPEVTSSRPANYFFGPIRLTRYHTQAQGNTLFVELGWEAAGALSEDYVTFVHVVGADGSLVAGQDRQPLGGYRPTSTWRVGDEIEDRFAFSLTRDQLAGTQVEVGWYSWPALERLPATDPAGQRIAGDSVPLR